MEISEKEYYELKERVSTLQSTVDSLQKPKRITELRSYLNEKVISEVVNLHKEKPIFGYVSYPHAEAWDRALLPLAKMVHRPSRPFYMSTHYIYPQNIHIRRSIDSIRGNDKLPNITDLTPEQVNISIQMLNEIIPIYNRYFKLMHQKVLYDPTGKGNYEPIGVIDEIL